MSSQSFSWRAEDLVSLGIEFQAKISEVNEQYRTRAQHAASEDEVGAIRQEHGSLLDAIQESFKQRVEEMSRAAAGGASIYSAELCGIDMDALVYEGDRAALTKLLSDPEFSAVVNQLLGDKKPYNARKELLVRGLKLTPGMAPLMYRVISHCTKALKLNKEIEVYVYQDAEFNAACFPPAKGKVLLMVTSSLLEKFTPRELAFVIGHELGHYLFEHTRFPVDYILHHGEGHLSPLHAMRLFAWMRNAEVTADRAGLLCCRDFDAAANAFFKLSSGITGTVLEFKLDDYLAQLGELQNEIDGADEEDSRDWFSSHPFSPLRVKALDLFHRSKRYNDLIGKPDEGELDNDELTAQTQALMSIMEPVHLRDDTDVGQAAQRYVLTAGYLVAAANGVVEPSELEALGEIVGAAMSQDAVDQLINRPIEETKQEVAELSEKLNNLMTPNSKLQLLRDMTVISYADGSVDEFEMECLYWLSENLQINPGFIDHVLHSAMAGMD
jgi:uncharacterized tellurite resistance protein B-like protein